MSSVPGNKPPEESKSEYFWNYIQLYTIYMLCTSLDFVQDATCIKSFYKLQLVQDRLYKL